MMTDCYWQLVAGGEEVDRVPKFTTTGLVADRPPDSGSESRGITRDPAVDVDRVRTSRVKSKQTHLGQHARPDQAGIADEREHDELSEGAPPLTSSPLE